MRKDAQMCAPRNKHLQSTTWHERGTKNGFALMTNPRIALYERLLTYDVAIDEVVRLRTVLNLIRIGKNGQGYAIDAQALANEALQHGPSATPGATTRGEDSVSITAESLRPGAAA